MAIVTGDLYKGFTFGDISSKAYGVYITQEAAYNAPERDVSVYEIAGRNGAYILDNGRFRNITVTYRCGIALDSETDFEAAVRSFRNALASQAGKYVRLTDEYNSDEFRQAAFFGGIEVEMADRRAGEFSVSFDCKPQRFLTSGEDAVTVTSGGTLTNPTAFESRPLLQVWGYGDIDINGEDIEIDDTVIGDVLLSNSTSNTFVTFSEADVRAGDSITLNPTVIITTNTINDGSIANIGVLRVEGDNIVSDAAAFIMSAREYRLNISLDNIVFSAGTSSTKRARIYVAFDYTPQGGEQVNPIVEYGVEVRYTTGRIVVSSVCYPNVLVPNLAAIARYNLGAVTAYSTKSALGEPLYFDLDIGEAYKEEDGEIISVNNAVSFPAELPTLKAGVNTFTYDNTVDTLKVVPRWWEV